MMSVMHAAFSKQLCEHILSYYGIRLKKNSFIYGSIKPDASTIFAKYPHYLNLSLEMLCARLSLLIDATQDVNEIQTRAFARELGVAMHYIADYFCRVHNDINGIKHNEHLGHIFYEGKMSRRISKAFLIDVRLNIECDIEKEILKINEETLSNYIIRKHNKYMREAGKIFLINNTMRRYELDAKYALEMIIVISSYVINEIIKEPYYGRI